MATLRAYLRGQTIRTGAPTRPAVDVISSGFSADGRVLGAAREEPDVAALMGKLNELVYESSSSNRYATLFYAHFDASTRALCYVNAGHNAPMIFRPAHEVVRLEAGGPVIGLIPGRAYAQGCITLAPTDVIVAFTDGITEAINASDDEWGEERLIDTVRRYPSASARQLIDAIMANVDAFTAGAAQHDDMTLVVLRVG